MHFRKRFPLGDTSSKSRKGSEGMSGNLKKNQLSYVEAMAISVAIMAPTAAMALNTSLTASIAGSSVPLTFLLAMITIGLVSASFIQFNRYYSDSGSVYKFAGVSLGAKVGFLSGWTLFLTYFVFTVASLAEVGAFMSSFFTYLGIHLSWVPVAFVCGILIWFLAFFDIKVGTRALLILEGISMVFILILVFVIFKDAHLNGYSAGTPFTFGKAGVSSVALASVFAFLSFAGFEGASSLGEETKNPKKAIPIAIFSAVFLTGLFYVLVSYAQTLGFGFDAKGIKTFSGSSAPLGDLASKFMSSGYAAVIMFGASLSAFSCALASATAGARMLFSMGRDGFIHNKIGTAHAKYGSPIVALSVVMIFSLILLVPLVGLSGTDVFGYLGTIGVLALLVAYLVTTFGGIVFFVRKGVWRGPILIIPVLAIVALLYTLYSNIFPMPAAPYNYFPYIVLGWIIVGIVITMVSPNLVSRIAKRLMEEGTEEDGQNVIIDSNNKGVSQ